MDINSLQSGSNLAYVGVESSQELKSSEHNNFQQKTGEASGNAQANVAEGVAAQQAKDLLSVADNKSTGDIETAVAEVSSFVQSKNQDLSFSFDETSNRSVIKVTDANSGDVIRQIPSEEVLKLSERIRELQSDVGERIGLGVLLNNQV